MRGSFPTCCSPYLRCNVDHILPRPCLLHLWTQRCSQEPRQAFHRSTKTEVPPDVTGEKKPTESFTQLSADQLDFRDWEAQDIYRLWPLFHTPRSVKRFINIYRLLRAEPRSRASWTIRGDGEASRGVSSRLAASGRGDGISK